ncbi:MAG: EAL domain-containing protein, partial [Pseudomonadota bacterium]|nr:EAL domain-containing protein [Pseudomonadota bacterium]
LALKLRDAGFAVRHLATPEEAQAALARSRPAAVVVEVDFAGEPLAGIGIIAEVRANAELTAPVFFIAEHGDLTTRLEAVRAGGAGYFVKPVDVIALVEKLDDQLFHQAAQGYRVLIVDDTPADAQWLAGVLEASGIRVQVLTQPLQAIQSLHRFRPDLLVLDLELKEVGGMELATAVRQHEATDTLPMVLLASQVDVQRRLAAWEVGGDALLAKPVSAELLLAAVRHRLRRARAIQDRLATLSLKDPVSGLYNRQHFLDLLERAVAGVGITTRAVGVMLILLDNLRAVRDANGVAAADELVEQASSRLQATLHPAWQTARFGDSVFVALTRDADDEAMLGCARQLREALEDQVYELGRGPAVLLRTSIGLSLAQAMERDPQVLIQQADQACSMARQAGAERIHLLRPQADRQVQESYQQRLLEEIREAVEQERMALVFQPIVSLRGDQTERYEVFLRMHNRDGQELLPETVFGIAQKHRLGAALDRWVIAQALRLLRERLALGRMTLLFINVSVATLQDKGLTAWLRERLDKSQVSPRALVFEMAEAAAEQHLGEVRRFLDEIRPLECGFSLERFGTRPESLRLLKNLAVNYVKLDARFASGLVNDAARQQELKRLVDALDALHVVTIVGGIEDLYSLPVLWSCGVNYVQGYFLQRPHKEMSYDFTGGVL